MPKIFISYRRKDTSYPTTMIYDFLEAKFGRENLFMDVDTIPAGVDFRQYLHEAVRGCDVVLVVIGEEWLVDRQGRRRIEDAHDFVRIEIEAALQRDIRVIPILVGDAAMPGAEELPESIQDLAFRHAVQVRPGRDLRGDIDRLIRELEGLPPPTPPRSVASSAEAPSPEPPGTPPVAEDWGEESPSKPAQPPRTIPGPPAKEVTPSGRPPLQPAGEVITNSIGMKLVLIPAGEFLMGSPDSDSAASKRERPQHRVRITRPFYLGVYPVTQEQYERVMGKNPSNFTGDLQRPVEQVSWEDATESCERLSKKEGKTYQLPTEAEWEYACRAGSTTKWCFGDSDSQLGEYAWHRGNSGGTTHPVGEKEPNAWGLYDMHGSVWEWCADWYKEDYYSASPAIDPKGPDPAGLRVLRGGSWDAHPGCSPSANPSRISPRPRHYGAGVRLARTP